MIELYATRKDADDVEPGDILADSGNIIMAYSNGYLEDANGDNTELHERRPVLIATRETAYITLKYVLIKCIEHGIDVQITNLDDDGDVITLTKQSLEQFD